MLSVVARDRYFMSLALGEARKAARKGEVPVGAVIVSGDRLVSVGRNAMIASNDPTAHAEVGALRRASRARKNYRLPDCELYVTLEPCAMCLGAIVQARIWRLVYGASDPKAGAVRSVMRFPFRQLNHRPEVEGGILALECGEILKEFFRARRAQAKR